MRSLELKIPPLVVTLGCAGLAWLAAHLSPSLSIAFPWLLGMAAMLAVAGVALKIAGILTFRRAQTTLNPINPGAASTIVSSGLYGVSRNPIYLGMLLVLAGWTLFLANGLAFMSLPVFIAYMNRFQIKPEERILSAQFGEPYQAYLRTVRRWI